MQLDSHNGSRPKIALMMPESIGALVLAPERRAALSSRFELLEGFIEGDNLAARLGELHDVDALLTGWYSPKIDSSFLEAAPHLKAVFHCAGSVNTITSEAFWTSEVRVSSANLANSYPVAEFAYAEIILSLKGFWDNVHQYRSERNLQMDHKAATGLRGATIGLLSFGSIAQILAKKLVGLPLRVITYDPYISEEDAALFGAEKVDLSELIQSSDVLSCHAPLTGETKGMLTQAHFLNMRPNATFINTSRGAVIDTAGMIAALKARPDLQAILDVTDPEPLNPDSELFELPNAIISGHIAGSIGNECFNLGDAMVEELERFFNGEPLHHEIKRQRAALMT
jgi:phosphoglycerate dehydrogenase-like enzyme